jgi:CO/xanthine dehydrogenase FAD-binding subunit
MASYLRPSTLAEALDALAAGLSEGRPRTLLAGATDHFPVRVGRVTDDDVVDISGLADHRDIAAVAGPAGGRGWWIPAGATWTGLVETPLPAAFDGLKLAARAIGGLQIQNRATIVGNVSNASPAADGVPVLLTLDSWVELASVRGTRRLPLAAFVTGNRTTERAPDELVTGLFVPDPAAGPGLEARSTFLKLGARAYLVISIAMVAAVLVVDGQGRIASARLAVGACSAVAQRLPSLEAALVGRVLEPGMGAALVRAEHVAGLTPIDDVRASAAYRREAARVLVARALDALAAGPAGSGQASPYRAR